jgi:hypothetical protein
MFAPDMLVFHQRKKRSARDYFQNAFKAPLKVKYIKNTSDFKACFMRIIYPGHLAYILCPLLLIFRFRFVNLKEIFLLPVIYISYILERILIWLAAIKERTFII